MDATHFLLSDHEDRRGIGCDGGRRTQRLACEATFAEEFAGVEERDHGLFSLRTR
jgi:hypothetical protein